MLSAERWRADGDLRIATLRIALIGLWAGGLALALGTVRRYATGTGFAFDVHAYWLTGQPDYVPYTIPPQTRDAFLYSPAFAQVIAPLTSLPWSAFAALWLLAETSAFLWLLRPLGWRWMLPLMLWCVPELAIGNVIGFLGVALAVAVRSPAAWSAMLLTKPTLGIGALWHAVRGEWRSFGVAAASTSAIVFCSLILDPEMWSAWIGFLLGQSVESAGTLPVRLVVALVLVVVAGRTGAAWLLAPALLCATPVLGGTQSLTILAAIPRLPDCRPKTHNVDNRRRAPRMGNVARCSEQDSARKSPLHDAPDDEN